MECCFIIIETNDTDKSMNESRKDEDELEFRSKTVHCARFLCDVLDQRSNRNQWLPAGVGTLGMTRKGDKETLTGEENVLNPVLVVT